MRSIRSSLMLGTVIGTLAIIAVAGFVVFKVVRSTTHEQFDTALQDKATLLAATVELTEGEIDLEFTEFDMREFEADRTGAYLQVWRDDGSVLYRSPSLGETELAYEAVQPSETNFRTGRRPDGQRIRSVVIGFRTRVDTDDDDDDEEGDDGDEDADDESDEDEENDDEDITAAGASAAPTDNAPGVTLILARGTDRIDAFLARLRTLLFAIGLAAGILLMVMLSFVVRKGLKPLDRLAGEIAHLDDALLSTRVRAPQAPKELAPLVDRLNELLSRLEAAFQRERSFSSNIAHELRTPLAGLRSTIEVAISRERHVDDYKTTLQGSLGIVNRMQGMVQTLLYLCRLDAGLIRSEEQSIDLDELVRASWQPFEKIAAARGIDIRWKLPPNVTVVTDPILLEVAIRNVLENAVTYANEGGYVRVELTGEGDRTALRVANSGSSISQDQVPRLMERFARVDEARDAAGSHCGLGLAIVTKIARVLRTTVGIRSDVGGEFDVTLLMRNTQVEKAV